MENKESKKSRLAEILWVEEDEVWGCQGSELQYSVHNGKIECCYPEDGQWYECTKTQFLIDIINHPEKIIHQPRLTPEELAICKALGARWVSRNGTPFCEDFVELWENEPCRSADSAQYINKYDENFVTSIRSGSFPSISPGDCVNVEEQ